MGGGTVEARGLAAETGGGSGAVNIGGGNECRGGVGLGGAELSWGAVEPFHDLLNARLEDTVVGGAQLRGVMLPLLKLLTLLLKHTLFI